MYIVLYNDVLAKNNSIYHTYYYISNGLKDKLLIVLTYTNKF